LAAPVIIGGIRTATVLVVGTATLVTPVGGKCLGNYIFGGLESMNPAATIFGCVVAALLAVVMDQLIHLEEVAARRRSRLLAWLGAVGLLLVFGGGLASPIAQLFDRRASAIIATGPFTEQHILNEVLALHLKARGFRADQRLGMSEGIQVEALKHNQIDCMVNYSGNIWTLVMKQTDVPANPDEVTPLVEAYLANEFGIISLGRLGFQDNYTFVMTAPGLTSLDAPTLDGLACFARQRAKEGKRLKIAADEQFFTRPEWRWVKIKYGLREEDLDLSAMSPALMYGALVSGARDVVVAYSSDGRIPAYGLEQLKDTKKALPPYDALLLVSSKAGRQPGVVEALAPLKDSIDETTMRRATLRVDEEHWTARRAAESLYYEER
jgi:osmoprotectant transport system permease protein